MLWRNLGLYAGLIGLGLTLSLSAEAETMDCARLRNQIETAPVADATRAGQLANTAAKQRAEIERTAAYSRSLGCDHRQFLFFGSPPPAQCDGLNARLAQMAANYNSLQAQAENAGGGAHRADLLARYDAYCRQNPQQQQVAPQPVRSLFDALFNSNPQDQQLQEVPINPNPNAEDLHARGGSQAICVRMADGGFFPVSYAAGRANLDELDNLCQALCPATETKLFTWNPNGDIKDAVSIDGKPYTSLPNALKFQTKYVPEARCKPADKSWAQVLGPAEEALGQTSKHDILVTPEKAAELSRVKDPKAVAALAKKTKTSTPMTDEAEAFTASLAAATSGPAISSGIGGGRTTSGPLITLTEGEMREIIGPDGVKRKVRIIAPTL
jgi:hypothetical protein